MPVKELRTIGEEAKEAKDVAEEAEIKDIQKKYFVN